MKQPITVFTSVPVARSMMYVALASGIVGCAALRGTPDLAADEVAVEVDNRNFYDATIYARVGSERYRVGTVTGHTMKVLTLERPVLELRFEIHLIGAAGTHTTDPMSVNPGDILQLIIPPDLHRRNERR